MEAQNSVGENQSSDRGQLIVDAKLVGSAPDCVQAVADGRGKVELGIGGGGVDVVKKKRGRPPKAQAKPPPAKKIKEVEEEEDVCFICFDGGSLVLCDRRGCPKAYHPACIKRDEAFFQNAARWNCGWHICSMCQKAAHHMCYTCTYSLCRGCIRKADYVCVRGDKGFCTICMKTIMLIENNGQGEDGKVQADFDDKLSWEYLFKVYWVYLKAKLSLTVEELTQAKNPWKGAGTVSSVLSTTGADNRVNDLRSITPATSFGNLEANESKRRKIDEQKVDEQINVPPKETVNTEKLGNDDSTAIVGCKEWATKELLDFIAHMKDGDTSVLSQSDVQGLMLEYINRNNLRDPRKKNQIICDSTLKNLFGKPRVGDIEMSTLLEYHFFIKDDSQKSTVNSTAVQENADLNHDNMLMVGKDKSPRNRSKGEERALQNKLDEYAAVDVHNMNLIYLRRDLIKNLLEDRENFHDKLVGSIVRIRLSGSDEKHDIYRLVQVVGTSKVDEPCQNNSKLEDVKLEVLNLDKKETILSNTVSNEEFTEEECRRLQQSIRCRLVKHFTVGEIQEKAVALQPVRLNDWMEREILRLNHLRDVSSEKGHKKGYRECVEKLQLLKAPDERERRLQEIPEVHSDPKMNPDYESDDTEEYFNKEHGDHMESKYSGVNSKNSRSPRKRAGRSNGAGKRSRKIEHPRNQTLATSQNVEEGSTALPSTLEKSQHEADCNGSTITKCDHQATLNSSVSNGVPEAIASSVSLRNPSSPNDMVWHYHDPSGKVQGPFSIVWLQRWSTGGCFPSDMRVWASQEDKPLLLTDVLKEHLHNDDVCRSENIMAGDKVGNQTEDLNVCSAIPSSTIAATPCAPNPVNHEKLSDSQGSLGQSFGQNWGANNNLSSNPQSVVSLTLSNESTGQLNTSDMPAATARSEADVNHVSSPKDADAAVIDLPGPIPKKTVHEDEKIHPVVDLNPPSWSSASSLVVGGAKLPVSADGWGGSSSTPVKHEEWDSGLVSASSFRPLEAAGDHVATPTSNIDPSIHPSQPACNDLPTWNGVGEMIEFSTLAEESVSDLLAEVDAMESQYGLPSPTSRRNSFVDDLFNGSFDEFSPTPDPGTRSDGFSSSGDIQLPCHSTTTDEHLVGSSQGNNITGFDVMKTSQQQSFMMAMGIPERRDSENMGFKWPEMIDINRSAKAEGEEGEMETKRSGGMQAPKSIGEKLVSKVVESSSSRRGGDKKEESGGLSLGLDPFEWHEPGTETAGGGGGVEDWGYNKSSRCWWNKQTAASKGKRVCRFYESGKCKKGASCKYLHP